MNVRFRVTSVYPSISDMILRRAANGAKGPIAVLVFADGNQPMPGMTRRAKAGFNANIPQIGENLHHRYRCPPGTSNP
jgi:hypothetical protein